jgi:predicted Zn-dependent protease
LHVLFGTHPAPVERIAMARRADAGQWPRTPR